MYFERGDTSALAGPLRPFVVGEMMFECADGGSRAGRVVVIVR